MTIRNLDHVFKPKSVALIGASQTRASVGNVVARNLAGAGFEGPVLAVNPKYQAVEGIPCHADIASLPSIPDLAIICTPPATVPGIVAALGARGTRAAVVITTGFGEGAGRSGAELKQAMLEAAKPSRSGRGLRTMRW
ncbi:MAG: CoA-binding protein [Gammaproteobacteria bacterium]